MNTLRIAQLFVFAMATLYAHGQQDKKQDPPEDSIRAAFLKHPEFQRGENGEISHLKFNSRQLEQIKKRLPEAINYLQVDTVTYYKRDYLFRLLSHSTDIETTVQTYPIYKSNATLYTETEIIEHAFKQVMDRSDDTIPELTKMQTGEVYRLKNPLREVQYELINEKPALIDSLFKGAHFYYYHVSQPLSPERKFLDIFFDGQKYGIVHMNYLLRRCNEDKTIDKSVKTEVFLALSQRLATYKIEEMTQGKFNFNYQYGGIQIGFDTKVILKSENGITTYYLAFNKDFLYPLKKLG